MFPAVTLGRHFDTPGKFYAHMAKQGSTQRHLDEEAGWESVMYDGSPLSRFREALAKTREGSQVAASSCIP